MRLRLVLSAFAILFGMANVFADDFGDETSQNLPGLERVGESCDLVLQSANAAAASSSLRTTARSQWVAALVDSPVYSWAVGNPELVFRRITQSRKLVDAMDLWETLDPGQVSDTLLRFLQAFLQPEMLAKRPSAEMLERRVQVTSGAGLVAEEFAQLVRMAQAIFSDPEAQALLLAVIERDVPVRNREIKKEKNARALFDYTPMLTLAYRVAGTGFEPLHENEVEQIHTFGDGLIQRHGELLARFSQLGEMLRLNKAWAPLIERARGFEDRYRAEEMRLLIEQIDTRAIAIQLLLKEVGRLRYAAQLLSAKFQQGAAALLEEQEEIANTLKNRARTSVEYIELDGLNNLYITRLSLFSGMIGSLDLLNLAMDSFAKSASEMSVLMVSLRTKAALSRISTQSGAVAGHEIREFGKRLRSALELR